MNKGFLVSILFVFGLLKAYSQSPYCSHHGSCLNEADPSNKESVSFLNKIESEYKKSILHKTKSRNITIELPIVVHIIHNNGPENISDDQVHLAIQHLNEAFANGGAYTSDIGIDTKIQFCLAQRDTLGNAINGIIRHQSSLTDMSTHFSNYKIAEIAHFNPAHYINIRIVKKSCYGFDCFNAGYAVPGYQLNQSFTNGITIQYDYFGKDAKIDNVAAHEMGHFLGLYHTFYEGCKNDNCLEDGDKVCDTPPDKRINEHCFYPSNSCNSDEDDSSTNNPFRSTSNGGLGDQNDLVSNFMDYNFKECKTSFTEGQSIRMDFFIHTLHSSLLKSKACLSPCLNAPEISCSLDKNRYEVGEKINFNSNVSQSSITNWTLNGISITNPVDHLDNLPEGKYALMGITNAIDVNCEPDTCILFFDIFCPVKVAFTYNIVDSSLVFDIDVSFDSFHQLFIYNSSGTNIYSSLLLHDSLTLTAGEYQVCLDANNGFCNKSYCNYISINPKNVEICDNSLDDDNDGYVDGFDSDCPCNDSLYNNLCEPICQNTNIDTSFELVKKWESEKIGSSWSTVLVYDTFVYTKKISGGYSFFAPESENAIVKISGISGKTISDISVSSSTSWPSDLTPLSVFKWQDTTFTLVLHRDTLMMYDEYYNKKWESYGWWQFARSAINVYDINLDGVPEIIISNKIVSIRSGIILLEDTIIKGHNSIGTGVGGIPFDRVVQCNSVSVDLLSSPGLEIVAGNVVYEVVLNNNVSSIGNQFIAHTADAPVQNGITSVGDIDGDGLLDVIVVRNQYYEDGGGIYVWNPRTGAMIARASSGESGSVPFVGDVDGDCHPEIDVVFANQLRMYKYDGTTNLKIMYTIPTSEGSGNTGMTMFDFNQDGKNELVYRDETTLRIFEGTTGKVLASTPMLSGTGMEYPVVADIDNDGQAEILTSGYMPGEEERDSRVYCFKSGGAPWAPARSVWNQYGYHVTNVNDDLTIPRYQQNTAAFFDTDSCAQFTCPQPYNNFMVQATYRTQEGCVVWPDPDCPKDEICNNGLDDDNDGYVDGFDSDCPCSDSLYNNLCEHNCEYTNIDTSFELVKKWESGKIGSSTSNILVFDTFIYTKKISGGYSFFAPESENAIVKISGLSGKTISENPVSSSASWPSNSTPMSVFKWKDTMFTIVLHRDTMMMFDEYHNKKWENYGWLQFARSAINVYDINSDGIPEIIISNKIISVINGNIILEDILIKGNNSWGQGFPSGTINLNEIVQTNTVIADLLPSPGLEIAAGNVVYEVVLNNNESSIGNQFIAHTADAPVQNGITSVGDIDGDGLLDVIVVRNQYYEDGGGIYVWNPRTGEMIARASSGESGSVPLIGDINGNCLPEIGVVFTNQLRMYQYDGTVNLNIMYNISSSDGSGFTGMTMFDFDQDGNNELIYRDQTTLRIFEGATGKVLASTPMLSGTGMEYPVVADIDNDGQAEILTSGYMPGEEERDSRVYCFKSGGAPWAPARSVWNQYGYHVTNVNDDLTIPRHQQNAASFFDTDSCVQFTCPQPYNNFMVQATYRTQEGCVLWPASDVSLDAMRYECNADSLIFYIVVGNEGNKNITEDTMDLSIYATIPDMTASPLERRKIFLSRDENGKVSRSDTIRLAMAMPNTDIKSLLFRLNDAGLGDANSVIHGLSPTLECDYENNIAAIDIDISTRILDLGPDIFKCRTEVVTLDAGDGFVTYLWNDLSEDDILSTSEAGVYSLIATDQCGRNYQDTVTFTIDESLKPNLGPDILLCEGDTTTISVGSEFTWVKWYPGEMVSCDTCFNTLITADTTFDLVLISNKSGCIDADTITIDIKALPRSEEQTAICAGTSIDFYGQAINDAGKYEHRLGQCDSLFILDVTVLRRDSTILSQDICVGDSILIFDTWYDSPTETTLTGKNVYGCDSIVQVSLRVIDTLTSVQSLSFCEGDSIFVQDRWIDTAGTYDFAFTSTRGCDSIATFEIVEMPTSSSVNNFSFCQGDSIFVADQWYYNAGSYEAVRTNALGCDSIITIEITTLPTSSDMRMLSICIGDSIQIHNTWQHQTGTYTETFTNSQGCDSTSVVSLNVAPYLQENDFLSICDGDSITVNGHLVYTAGLYVDTINVDGSCQKILTTQVTLIDRIAEDMMVTICPDSSAKIGNLVIDESGTFTVDLISQAGCDSTLTIIANKLLWPKPPTIKINCQDEQYTATWTTQAPWNIEWSDGSTDSIFRQEKGGTFIMRSYTDGCEKVFEYELPQIPKLSDIPQLGDQLVKGSDSLPLTVNLDESSWTIAWSPEGLFSCATCFDTDAYTASDTTVTVIMTHESGCSFEQQFRIIRDISSVISIPNIFNPGSTGGNDLWTVTVPFGSLVAEVHIYDRWGNQVFTSKNGHQITWDGNYQGKALSTGVYVYHVKVVDVDGKISMLYGDVTLVK